MLTLLLAFLFTIVATTWGVFWLADKYGWSDIPMILVWLAAFMLLVAAWSYLVPLNSI